MNFTSQIRHNPETGKDEKYYRLKESYRNASGNACTRILLNVGFIHGLKPEEIRDISKGLTYKYEHQCEQELWEDQMAVYSDIVREKIEEYWAVMVERKNLDIIPNAIRESQAKTRRRIDVDTTAPAACQVTERLLDAVVPVITLRPRVVSWLRHEMHIGGKGTTFPQDFCVLQFDFSGCCS